MVWCGGGVFPGLEARPFQGLPRVQEVECSGRPLEPGSSVSSMVLYDQRDQGGERILASVNTLTGECTTGGAFSACLLHGGPAGAGGLGRGGAGDSRLTRLRTLVLDLAPGDSRKYGCEVTSLRSGERSRISTWSLTVRAHRELLLLWVCG